MTRIATWNSARDVWETEAVSLLSGRSDVFSGTFPISGMTVNGVAYRLPTSAHHTGGSGSSFSQLGGKLLTTPTTTQRGTDANLDTREGARANLHNEVVELLKTPTAQLAVNGGSQHPDKRKAGGHGPTLADEVEHLLPTPKAGDADFGMPRTSGRPPEKSTHLMTRLVYTLPIGPDLCERCGHDDIVHDADGFCAHCSPHDCRDIHGQSKLLPTPTVSRMPNRSASPGAKLRPSIHEIHKLLPTPNTMEHLPARTGEARERQLRRGEGPDASRRQSMGNLREDIVEVPAGEWGPYAAAIARWESVLGRPAPAPTEEGPKGGRRLSSLLVEWMMGLPEGWVTGHGLPRTAELKMLGNGCVPQQVIAALREMVS